MTTLDVLLSDLDAERRRIAAALAPFTADAERLGSVVRAATLDAATRGQSAGLTRRTRHALTLTRRHAHLADRAVALLARIRSQDRTYTADIFALALAGDLDALHTVRDLAGDLDADELADILDELHRVRVAVAWIAATLEDPVAPMPATPTPAADVDPPRLILAGSVDPCAPPTWTPSACTPERSHADTADPLNRRAA